MTKKEHTYESALEKLESILNRMKSEDVSLEESIQLFQEADKLVTFCSDKLKKAETKIEAIVKSKEGRPLLSKDGDPTVEEFHP
jgi:exodeoxyribonuclease VII small subunit